MKNKKIIAAVSTASIVTVGIVSFGIYKFNQPSDANKQSDVATNSNIDIVASVEEITEIAASDSESEDIFTSESTTEEPELDDKSAGSDQDDAKSTNKKVSEDSKKSTDKTKTGTASKQEQTKTEDKKDSAVNTEKSKQSTSTSSEQQKPTTTNKSQATTTTTEKQKSEATTESPKSEPTTQAPASSGSTDRWIWVKPTTHQEWVVDKAAWTETRPKYASVLYECCNSCDFLWQKNDEAKAHEVDTGHGGYHDVWIKEQVGTETVTHEAEGHWEEVSDNNGYWIKESEIDPRMDRGALDYSKTK